MADHSRSQSTNSELGFQNLGNKNEILTMTKTLEILRISKPTLYGLINRGELETYKIGNRRYTTNDLLIDCLKRLKKRCSL